MTAAVSADGAALALVDPLLWKMARRYARAGVDAEDLLQEARLEFLTRFATYDPDRSTLSTFASQMARAAMCRYWRDRAAMIRKPAWVWDRGDREELAPQAPRDFDCGHDPSGSMDAKIYVDRLLSMLGPRHAFVMRKHMDGYTDVEIAAMLVLTRAQVQKLRTQACLRLERLLDSDA